MLHPTATAVGGIDPFRVVVIELEGGDRLTDDPLDPGGRTRWGLSQKAHPDIDVRTITEVQARAIYHVRYWRPLHCPDMDPGKALAVFDTAVNHGVGTATRLLQQAAGVRVDGNIGPITLTAVQAMSREAFVRRLLGLRAERYLRRDDATEERFELGWINRLITIAIASMAS